MSMSGRPSNGRAAEWPWISPPSPLCHASPRPALLRRVLRPALVAVLIAVVASSAVLGAQAAKKRRFPLPPQQAVPQADIDRLLQWLSAPPTRSSSASASASASPASSAGFVNARTQAVEEGGIFSTMSNGNSSRGSSGGANNEEFEKEEEEEIRRSWMEWPGSHPTVANSTATSSADIRRQLLGTSCDYRQGKWVYVKGYRPAYSGDCKYIRSGFNCERNGRKNMDFMNYRWQPAKCALPRFSASTFLSLLKNKIIAFIGDSISRNFQQSVSCLLAAQVTVEEWTGHLGPDSVIGLKIPSHNVRILAFMTPFLVRYTNEPWAFELYGLKAPKSSLIKGGNGAGQGYVIWTDVLDSAWTVLFRQLDVVVFMSGHWFLQAQGDTDVRSLQFVSNNRPVKLNGKAAYRAVITRVKKFLDVEAKFKGIPMWLTYSPSHYRSSTYPPSCPDNKPAKTLSLDAASTAFRSIELQMLQNTRFSVLDLTAMSALRPDGHAQTFYGPVKNSKTKWDCLHWCLPGVPDAWSDVLQLVLQSRLR